MRLTARDQKRSKTYHALDDVNLDFDAAKKKAEAWIEQTTHTAATREDFEEWRERHRPGRQDRTINRQTRSVVAGLNRALELGHVGNPLAWKLKKLSDDTEHTNETAIFLTSDERKALLGATDPSTADLLRGIDHTGARPHELAGAIVSDFDGTALRLAHRKGRPPRLRGRVIEFRDGRNQMYGGRISCGLRAADEWLIPTTHYCIRSHIARVQLQ